MGLLIDDKGIIENSNSTSIGRIKWEDIRGIRLETTRMGTLLKHSQKFILVDVSNPQEYLDRKKKGLGKTAMKMNFTKFGTPICITANTLKVDIKVLENQLLEQYDKFKTDHV